MIGLLANYVVLCDINILIKSEFLLTHRWLFYSIVTPTFSCASFLYYDKDAKFRVNSKPIISSVMALFVSALYETS